MPAKSRRVHRYGARERRSTTGCCRSRKSSAPRQPTLATVSRCPPKRPPVTAKKAKAARQGRAAGQAGMAPIGNPRQLLDHGLTDLRRVVLEVAAAGLRSADPGLAVERLVKVDGGF